MTKKSKYVALSLTALGFAVVAVVLIVNHAVSEAAPSWQLPGALVCVVVSLALNVTMNILRRRGK